MLQMLTFDEEWLVAALSRVSRPARVAFAASCAERLVPTYKRFSDVSGKGDPRQLALILDHVWKDIQGVPMTRAEVAANLDACMALIPTKKHGDTWVPELAPADDCVAAVAYALRCRQSGDAQESAWAGRQVYNAVDEFVINQEKIDTNQAGGEHRVLSHPLVQAELARQRQDISELLAIGDEDLRDEAKRLRDRARSVSLKLW
jgi:uncharacterized protein YjaG (DUF416 family)